MSVRDEHRPSEYGAKRASSQREAIARVADRLGRAFSPDDLLAAAREVVPKIGVATLYRAVTAMEESDFIERIGSRDGAALFARCHGAGHHHHLVCTGCGLVAETDCPVHPERSAENAGFKITGHSLTLYGLCPLCQEPAAQDGGGAK